MASEDMKKMLMLVESCSCEQSQELDEVDSINNFAEEFEETSVPEEVEEDFDFDAFLESIREMTGSQLDELKPDTYFSASDARKAQKLAQAKNMGVADYAADSDTAPAPVRGFKAAQDRLNNTGLRRQQDQFNFNSQVSAVKDLSPATQRKMGLTPTKQFTKADRKTVTDMRPHRPTAPAVKESEPTQEDAEFQSFMETLSNVLRHK